jgi:uracil phosphoribosyltransferase
VARQVENRPLTVIDDHANDHSGAVPMRGDTGDRMFAAK